ncbi:MAG: substrate-binding domain-containing protein, partial [Tannerella sp.]|nr:substrate-binding domain-containing protein [Tannerella sp.]
MRRLNLLLLTLCGMIFSSSAQVTGSNNNVLRTVEGITIDNYPRVDGSTSTKPLNRLVACKLLGFPYEWRSNIVGEWSVEPLFDDVLFDDIPEYWDLFGERIKVSQTHESFINLIDNNTDLILTHRTLSPDEQAHADETGVSLIETSIAIDPFVFIVNKNNPVRTLTVAQVRDIFAGNITNWQQVGGNDAKIRPFVRPRNSGSQEVMESLVMKDLTMGDFPKVDEIASMAGVFPEVINDANSISYTFNYYKETMVRTPDERVPKIAINGIFPNEKTVMDGTYPFIAEVHVAIRSDLDKNSMAYRMYEWLQSAEGKAVIAESGYIPTGDGANSIQAVGETDVRLYPNPVTDGFYISGLTQPAHLTLIDTSGRRIISRQVAAGEYVSAGHLPKG